MTNREFKGRLEQRTLAFSVALLNFLARLPDKRVFWVIATQLAKCGTSIGANYREANRAESKADFVHKIGIVEKESSETVYWLAVLSRVSFLDRDFLEEVEVLHKEASELLAIFSTVNRKCKA
jgi:four helix bundle protein